MRVTAVFGSEACAERAAESLAALGVLAADMSVLPHPARSGATLDPARHAASDRTPTLDFEAEVAQTPAHPGLDLEADVTTGAGWGAAAGSGAGTLLGLALALIPGAGPLLGLGALTGHLDLALTLGLLIGAATGAILGAIHQASQPPETAYRPATEGGVLLAVETGDGTDVSQVRTVLAEHGGEAFGTRV